MGIDPDQDGVDLIERFCDAWLGDVVPNQPIRIGQATFAEGKGLW